MVGKTIDQLALGDSAKFTKTVSESDVYLYTGLTGDLNPAISLRPMQRIPILRPEYHTACS